MNQHAITVLKFGSSFLQTPADLTNAVQEIYEAYRQGRKVVVVVSAMGKSTESLISQARAVHSNPGSDPHAYAELLATGEGHSACLLTLALQASGISSAYLNVYELGLFTQGDPLDSDPVRLERSRIGSALARAAVVVVPGFVGLSEERKVTLLGRGGSDLSAIFLAEQLRAKACILLKDVNGIYDSDPNLHPTARRFETISYDKALRLGAKIVQQKAIAYASGVKRDIRVTASVRSAGTLIGAQEERYETVPANSRKNRLPQRVLLLGLGTVGRGVYDELRSRPEEYDVRKILVRDPAKHLQGGIPAHLLLDRAEDVWTESEYDLVVELLGGTGLAKQLIEQGLQLGVDVVSANKALIASDGKALEALATDQGAHFLYSAAVGGSVPVLETIALLQDIAGKNKIRSITGVVNGTCNFILDQLVGGLDFSTALKKAQELGFAEADPTADISGADSAQKLSLIIDKAFGVEKRWQEISCDGIQNLPDETFGACRAGNQVVRLVAHCERRNHDVLADVRPRLLPKSHPLAQVKNEENVFLIETEEGNTLSLVGKGAGRTPTARSVLADIYSIAP